MHEARVCGRLVLVTGTSGSGKTTLIDKYLEKNPDSHFSISCTSRAFRPGEEHGLDYYFMTDAECQAMKEAGEFLEWALVYGQFYGTPRSEVLPRIESGTSVVADVEINGVRQIKEKLPEALSVYIMPPSRDILEARLRSRMDTPLAEIGKRLASAPGEIEAFVDNFELFDFVIMSDNLDVELDRVSQIVKTGKNDYCVPHKDFRLAGQIEASLHSFGIDKSLPTPKRFRSVAERTPSS